VTRAPSVPPQIPGLDFVRLLGAGGFSDVFLYDQKLPRRRVAVKVLLTDGLNSAARDAFVDEANLMAQLSAHPYIVTIFHADIAPGDRPYFLMEYCSGPSLAELYKKEPFTVADALRIGVRLSSAIATAHAAGILHRDIKPANVLTNDFGWPALTDFGISSAVEEALPAHTTTAAELRDATAASGATESQSVGMSVPWSPPEMFEDAPRPDVRSDVFSLAATIYTLLAGRTPFEIPGRSNGTLDLIGRIERGTITPLTRDDVPRSFVAVLQKGMSTNRADRYATAVDFARALQRIELELGYTPTTIEVPRLGGVPEREHHESTDAADETRVRAVASIEAQPAIPPISAMPAASIVVPPPVDQADETRVRPITVIGAPSALDEATVHRSRPSQAEEPDVASSAPASAASAPTTATAASPAAASDEAPARRRPRPAVLVAIIIVVVVALAVIAGVVFAGGSVRNQALPKPKSTGTGGSAIVSGVVPTPVLVSTTPIGTTQVTFTWKNPDPKSGDTYRWAHAEQPDVSEPLTAPTVTVTRPSPGTRVCIDVVVQRNGETSSTPLEACDPK
jgi:serine/threonine protein kinase